MRLNIISETDILNRCDIKTPKWSFEGRTVNAKCVKVYDGDTATFVFIPHPNHQPRAFSCRLLGYNAAEIKTKDPAEKLTAIKSRDYLSSVILNKIIRLELGSFDKYGRILVNVYVIHGNSTIHVNDTMIKHGYGMPYDGTGPKRFNDLS